MKTVINIEEKLAEFSDHWNPKVIAELNGQMVKLAKIKGPFVWHSHESEDELFYVIKGVLSMEFRDRTENIKEGEIIVIPKGVEHRPVADQEVHIMLFEPASTINTGEVSSNLTRSTLDRI
jgi:mannose-6-phosphate isomerase-like protein (cupin superfamily)